jgi:hypothetical protein
MWSKVARDVNGGSLGAVLRREASRSYMSRAHPTMIPEFPIPAALGKVIEGIQDRKVKRVTKWELNAPRRLAKGIKVRAENVRSFHTWRNRVSVLTSPTC